MNDDWRLRVELGGEDQARALTDRLGAFDLEHELRASFGDRIIVSRDGAEVFCYADTRGQAEAAERAISLLADRHGWQLTTGLTRWHPVAEEWEDPDAPLPADRAGLAAEHAERIADEREESRELGSPEWEVRVECHSHHDTAALAEQLESEGLQPVRRWRYLLVGAPDEDSARTLAGRLTAEAPAGCTVTVEGSAAAVMSETLSNPFAVFGGLGG